jgi:alkylated DNA repair dioxygenase AlkB
MTDASQLSFLQGRGSLPEGFCYQPGILTPEQEEALLPAVRKLPFREFEFGAFVGKRRTVSFGWKYDYTERELQKADPIPEFLRPVREAAGRFAQLPPQTLEQISIIEYGPGAGIGWHRDKPMFSDVIGISLLVPCRFRFRRKAGTTWERASIIAEPRSIYLMRGPSRTEWEHSIPPLEELRYSITFRNLRGK